MNQDSMILKLIFFYSFEDSEICNFLKQKSNKNLRNLLKQLKQLKLNWSLFIQQVVEQKKCPF